MTAPVFFVERRIKMEQYELDKRTVCAIKDAAVQSLNARKSLQRAIKEIYRQRRENYLKEGHTVDDWNRNLYDRLFPDDETKHEEENNLKSVQELLSKIDADIAALDFVITSVVGFDNVHPELKERNKPIIVLNGIKGRK